MKSYITLALALLLASASACRDGAASLCDTMPNGFTHAKECTDTNDKGPIPPAGLDCQTVGSDASSGVNWFQYCC
ncbi:hypothetical protein LZ30DRAFT_742448, partial [Colletotrichum cereale]